MNKQHKAELTRVANVLIESGVKHDGDMWQSYEIDGEVYDINIFQYVGDELKATAYPVVEGDIDTTSGVKLNIGKGK
jgi:hypothetical protein